MERVRCLASFDYRGKRVSPGEIILVPPSELEALVKGGLVEWVPFEGEAPVEVRCSLPDLIRQFEGRRRRTEEVLAVAAKLVGMGWIEEGFGRLREDGEAVELEEPVLKQEYSLEQISKWAGAGIRLRIGTLPRAEQVPPESEAARKLSSLGFECVREGERRVARKILVTCGGAGAWLEAEV